MINNKLFIKKVLLFSSVGFEYINWVKLLLSRLKYVFRCTVCIFACVDCTDVDFFFSPSKNKKAL